MNVRRFMKISPQETIENKGREERCGVDTVLGLTLAHEVFNSF